MKDSQLVVVLEVVSILLVLVVVLLEGELAALVDIQLVLVGLVLVLEVDSSMVGHM